MPIPLRLLIFASVPALLIGVGTVGYHLTEGWSWFDSFYVAVITLTSIGYGDKFPLSNAGRAFTVMLAIGGVSTVAVAATELLRTIITGELRQFMGRWRMKRRIEALEQHVIVCGYGDVGRHVCADLLGHGVPVVVIDRQAAPVADAAASGAHPIVGDASVDATLKSAGIDRARALIAVAGTDPDNVLITMTARLLVATLTIVARAEDETTVPKLMRAGASRTARPHAIAGGRMAEAVLHPGVLDADLRMQEQLVAPGSALDGKTVGSSGLRTRRGPILVAIRHRDGGLAFNPDDDAVVSAGDTRITLGTGRRLAGIGAGAHAAS
jgi:voltage-gated potassium channel